MKCVFAKQCEKITAELWKTETGYSQKLPSYLGKVIDRETQSEWWWFYAFHMLTFDKKKVKPHLCLIHLFTSCAPRRTALQRSH